MQVLGNKMIGDEAGVQRRGKECLAEAERARQLGPRIQSFENAANAGGSAVF